MKKVFLFYFIRHGQLVKPYNDHSAMDRNTLADLALSKLDPGIRANSGTTFNTQTRGINLSQVKFIYYNNSGFQSRRSLQSAKLIRAELKKKYGITVPVRGLPELKEIKFYVKKLVNPELFKTEGMPILRKKFFQAILTGGPVEKLTSIQKRTDKILSVIRRHEQAGERVLFVTHAFFMRFLELALEKKQPTMADMEAAHINQYFGGFIYNLKKPALKFFGKPLNWDNSYKILKQP